MSEGQVVGTISIKVTPDTSKFRRELKAELDAIEREEQAKVKVAADFDKDGLKEKVKAAAEEANTHTKVKVDVNTDYLKGKIAHELSNFRTKVKVEPDIDRSLLSRLRGGFRGGPGGPGIPGGFGGGGGGSPLSGVGSIGNFGSPANLLAIAAVLPPALAIAAPALASLPALLSAVALPIGTLVLGMDGLKKAAEDAGLAVEGKDKKGKPNGKLTVGGALKQLQEGVSGVFEKGFLPILNQLVAVAPQVTAALKGVAGGIVNLAQGAVNALVSPQGQNQLNTLSANIGGLLSASAPGLQSFTTGLINLATQVSTHFPGLAKWFNEMGEKFSNWVTKISQDGTLDKAISGLKPVLDGVVSFVGNLMDAGLKLAADPAMVGNIKTVLDSITNFVVSSLPALTQTFETLAGLLHSLGLDKPAPTLQSPGGKPGTPGQPAQPGLPGGPTSLMPAAPGSDGKFSWWSPPKKPVNPGFLDQVEESFTSGGWLKWMDEHVGGPLSRFFKGPKGNGQDFGGPGSLFNSVFGGSPTPQAHADTVPFNPGPAASAQQVPGSQQVIAGAAQAGQQAQQVAGQIKGAFDGIPGQLQGVWQSIQAGSKGAFDGLVNAAKTAVQQIIAEIQRLPGEVTQALSGLRAAGESAGQALGQGLTSGINASKGAAVAAAQQMAADVEAAAKTHLQINSPSKVFHGIGLGVGEGFQTGIDAGVPGVVDSATRLIDQLRAASEKGVFPPELKQNVRDELKAIGQEYDTLKVQRDALDPKDKPGRKNISDQMKQLQTLRNQLKLDQDKFPDAKKPTAKKDMDIGQMFGQELQKLPGVGANFAMANLNQFEQDLGMSGKGAVPTILNMGVQWGTSFMSNLIGSGFGNQGLKGGDTHIHVNSVDEAMAVKQNEQNRKAMTYAGR